MFTQRLIGDDDDDDVVVQGAVFFDGHHINKTNKRELVAHVNIDIDNDTLREVRPTIARGLALQA